MRRGSVTDILRRVLAVLFLAFSFAALGQDDAQLRIDGWNATLDQIAATLRRPGLAAGDLVRLRNEAQAIHDGARAFAAGLQPRIDAATALARSLAPPAGADPPGAAPEIPALAAERERAEQSLAELTGRFRQAEAAALRADDLLGAIAERRSLHFTTLLFERGPSLLSPALWRDVAAEAPDVLARAGRLFADWWNLVSARADRLTAILLAALAILAPLLFWLARRFLGYVTDRLAEARVATAGRKAAAATWVAAVSVAVPSLFVVVAGAILAALGFLPPRIKAAFDGILFAVVAFTLVNGLALAVLAPTRPNWRLATLDDAAAQRLYRSLFVVAFLVGAIAIVDRIAAITVAEPSFAMAIGGAIAVAIAIVLLLAARTFGRDREGRFDEPGERPWRWAITLAGFAAFAAIASGIAGYVAFARFLTGQIVWVGIVLALLALMTRLADLIVGLALSPDRPVGRWFMASLAFSRRGLGLAGVIVGGGARLLLAVLALLAMAAPWGFDSASLAGGIRGLFYGVTVGTITITFSAIVAALAVFILGIVVTRIVQSWLENRLLPTTSLDPGLRASIRTGIGYLGVILAAIFAGAYAGLDLVNIAIVAGALSVGIGFGLQSIVNNFVSGLILLAERPIRAGDWIAVGGEEGTVRRINVRSTEVETFDRATVIIPNSALITGVVKNMVLRDRSGRITIPVSVGYGADAGMVRDLLLDCAGGHPKVLGFPEPEVLLLGFGASSLDFELRCFLAEISEGPRVRSDLRFAILERMRDLDVERPTAQATVEDKSYKPPKE